MSRGHVTCDEVSRYRAGAASSAVILATCRTPGPGHQDQLGSPGHCLHCHGRLQHQHHWHQQQSEDTKVYVIFHLTRISKYKARTGLIDKSRWLESLHQNIWHGLKINLDGQNHVFLYGFYIQFGDGICRHHMLLAAERQHVNQEGIPLQRNSCLLEILFHLHEA